MKQVGINMTIFKQIYVSLVLIFSIAHAAEKIKIRSLMMPNVRPIKPNEYLCTAFKMPSTKAEYIVEFSPYASTHTAHHVFIAGCESPGLESKTPQEVWDCGHTAEKHPGYHKRKICAGRPRFVYTWSLGLQVPDKLPEGVGFKVGKGTGINYLVLQVHYLHVDKFLEGETDNTGVVIKTVPGFSRSITKRAGIYMLGQAQSQDQDKIARIKAHQKVNLEAACRMSEDLVMHPISFQPHTHGLGTMVSGFKIDSNETWHLIGKHNPQEPQVYYPVENPNMTISKGDILAARCTYYNFRENDASIGETESDEMCNFYLMYSVDKEKPILETWCFPEESDFYSWKSDPKIKSVPPEIDVLASEP